MSAVIEPLARALMAQLSPLMGDRATATATVVSTGATGTAPRNAYLAPVVGGRLSEHLLFKVAPDPSTLQANGSGGDWAVTSAGTPVTLVSNLGGARHNLPDGTVLRWMEPDPPAGLEPTVTLTTAATGGADGVLRQAHFFEQLDGAATQRDIFAARLGHFPAVVLAWSDSAPAEGLTSGVNQGSTRRGRRERVFRETFALIVVATRTASDPSRRSEGLRVMEWCTAQLTDRQRNDDGELLSVGGGLEVRQRRRLSIQQNPTAYLYEVTFCVSSAVSGSAGPSVWGPWDFTRTVVDLPGDPDDLRLVDVTDPMP